MIVFITTGDHKYTLATLQNGTFGFPTPRVQVSDYDHLFGAESVPRATYVFADLERLTAWELRIAAELYRVLSSAGVRCLNDPARTKTRVELLRALHNAGLNPFNVYRADEQPRPARFPVFIRFEMSHGRPRPSALLPDQEALNISLDTLRRNSTPLRGMMVIEYCGMPYSPNLWHKWSTFRVGDRISVDHIAVDDYWLVKYGDWEKLTDEAVADEHDAVTSNRFAADLASIFDVAGIEFGRADHAFIEGRTVVYEINTNPGVGPYVPDPKPLRLRTQSLARRRLAEALETIDCEDSGAVKMDLTPLLREWCRRP
jgi:hypothetical protein